MSQLYLVVNAPLCRTHDPAMIIVSGSAHRRAVVIPTAFGLNTHPMDHPPIHKSIKPLANTLEYDLTAFKPSKNKTSWTMHDSDSREYSHFVESE